MRVWTLVWVRCTAFQPPTVNRQPPTDRWTPPARGIAGTLGDAQGPGTGRQAVSASVDGQVRMGRMDGMDVQGQMFWMDIEFLVHRAKFEL